MKINLCVIRILIEIQMPKQTRLNVALSYILRIAHLASCVYFANNNVDTSYVLYILRVVYTLRFVHYLCSEGRTVSIDQYIDHFLVIFHVLAVGRYSFNK